MYIGEEFAAGKSITLATVADTHTKLTLTPTNLFAAGVNNDAKCELYYSVSGSDSSKFPATCEINGQKKLCFDTCTNTFNIVNLNPKTSYKITVCSKGYTCTESSEQQSNFLIYPHYFII